MGKPKYRQFFYCVKTAEPIKSLMSIKNLESFKLKKNDYSIVIS